MAQVQGPNPNIVREWRAAAGLTQAQAAELVYVTKNAWERWEIDGASGSARRMPFGLFELFCIKVARRPTTKKQ